MKEEVKDYTWPICKDCVNRELRAVHTMWYDPKSGKVQEERVEHYYICWLGITELDKHPNQCKYKVLCIPQS